MRVTMSNLKTRLQIAKEVLKEKDYNGQIMTCGNCGSTYIEKIAGNKNATCYQAQYVCKNCGCHCTETQIWRINRNDT